jgi:hypothetical protein
MADESTFAGEAGAESLLADLNALVDAGLVVEIRRLGELSRYDLSDAAKALARPARRHPGVWEKGA